MTSHARSHPQSVFCTRPQNSGVVILRERNA
jgi:hypothetical protein